MALNIDKNKKVEAPTAEVVEKVAPVETPVEAPEGGVYGQKRKTVAFVAPLGDPSKQDTTTVKALDGTKSKKVTSTIVGYRFRILEDMQIPDCGTNAGLKDDPMNFDVVDRWRPVKAGEEVDLTPFETALLLSQPQFNGGCDGGEKPVSCVYLNKNAKSKDGKNVATASAASSAPRVSLRAQNGSIKDYDIIDVLTFESVRKGNVTVKERTIKPEFKKWAPLAEARVRKSAGRASKAAGADDGSRFNPAAQAFLTYVKAKAAQK